MYSPTCTIIIPTLNAGKTLQKALDSVLSQQFVAFEVLIIDSLSRDNTIQIAKENAQKDRRIRFISESDKGVYDAMNKAIGMAEAEWVYFLGSDDYFHNNGVLQSVFGGDTIIQADFLYGNVIGSSYKGVYDGEFNKEKLLRRNISHQAIFFKKDLFDLVGNFNIRYKAYADWDLNIRCFSNEKVRIRYQDLVIAEFGAGGISSRHDIAFLREVLIPAKLEMLSRTSSRSLRNIRRYDEWWRLIRNAGIRDLASFTGFAGDSIIPKAVSRMVRWESRVPYVFLRNGGISKCIMFVSYLINRLIGSI
jgi:glycosyltransferase involved in cell wall biosynthesis